MLPHLHFDPLDCLTGGQVAGADAQARKSMRKRGVRMCPLSR
jgi:hypothetical protein